MEEAINNVHDIDNVHSKQSTSIMEHMMLESDKANLANNSDESDTNIINSSSNSSVPSNILTKVFNTVNSNDGNQNIEDSTQASVSESVENDKAHHGSINSVNSSNGERAIQKNSLEQLCAEIVGDTDLGDADLEYQETDNQQYKKTYESNCDKAETPADETPIVYGHTSQESATDYPQESSEKAASLVAVNEGSIINIPEHNTENNVQLENSSDQSYMLNEMNKIINSPIEIPNIPLPVQPKPSMKVLSITTEHTNEYLEINNDDEASDKTIATDVEISLIHGEAPVVDNSIVESLSNKNLKFISRVSTQEIMDVYNKQDVLRKMITITRPLNNSDCFKDSLNFETNGGSLINLGQDTAVMNDSQLLAILEEGNEQTPAITPEDADIDVDKNKKINVVLKRRPRAINLDPVVEGQLALKQLKELPLLKRKNLQKISQIVDVKIPKTAKKIIIVKKTNVMPTSLPIAQTPENCDPLKSTPIVKTYSKKSTSDISDIMAEWDDEKPEDTIDDSVCTLNDSSVLEISTDLSATPAAKKPDVLLPQRVSRIIKKKIIFDPDNPDTFKFAAATIKKDKIREADVTETLKIVVHKLDSDKSASEIESKIPTEKIVPKLLNKSVMFDDEPDLLVSEQVIINKPKVGRPRLVKTGPNKINLLNAQLDKPRKQISPTLTPNKKKKMTEVDRLLMDEGAVNMLYEMSNNSDAANNDEGRLNKKSAASMAKEKKSMISKAKIIKRAVFSLTKSDDPSKVLKVFRSRKEGTQKTNRLRSGMQSPTISEVSASGSVADESRIIRRHSSSSFSSGCLSPRPSSPENIRQNSTRSDESYQLTNDSGIQSSSPLNSKRSFENIVPVPMSGKIKRRGRPPNSISAKQKRLADDSDTAYQRKAVLPMSGLSVFDSFTQLSLAIGDDRVARIVVQPTGNMEELYDVQVLKELATAIRVSNQAGAVLLTSEHGNLCSGLDLRCIIQPTVHLQRENAENILSAFRELAVAMCECECGIVSGVDGACCGVGVPLLTLSDLSLASDRATFCAAPRTRRPMPPEGASLLVRPHSLPSQLSRELVLCGRKLTASEALQRGLVSRTLWPDRFIEEIKSIAADLTSHPPESFKIMKNMLRRGESEAVVAALRHEGKMLKDFWCSAEGQEAIQKSHEHL